jgi:hypothetical protein
MAESSSSDLSPHEVSDTEWKRVVEAASRLPFQHYSEIYNPLPVPADGEPVVGNLADDLADVYRDVVTGLRLHEAGRENDALWHWTFNLRHHWGEHAISAIRAFRWYLAEHDAEFSVHGA